MGSLVDDLLVEPKFMAHGGLSTSGNLMSPKPKGLHVWMLISSDARPGGTIGLWTSDGVWASTSVWYGG